MYDPKYNITTGINIFVNFGIEILLNIIILLLPIFIIPAIENFFSHLFHRKTRKENVYKDLLKIICIYLIFPFLLIVIVLSAFISVGLIMYNEYEQVHNFTIFFLKICTQLCILYIFLYCIGKSKIYANKILFFLSILLILYRIFTYHIRETIMTYELEEEYIIFLFLFRLTFLSCCSITPVTIYYIFCYFIKKLVVIRKKLIIYSYKEQKKIWKVIRIPLLLDVWEMENIIFSTSFFNKCPYIFVFIHIFWLLFELLSINIVIFYIYRPTYTIQKYIFYNITLKSGKQFNHIPICDLISKKEIIKVKIENELYYFNEKDVEKVCEEKEYKYSFSDKKIYIIKSILLWIIEICAGLLIFIKETI